MAGLDGVQNKIHPGEAADKNLYDLPPEEDAKIPTVCSSLDQALEYLDKDREFLTRGGVFSNDMIDAYIELKMEEVTRFRMTTHPVEFDMYYSLLRRAGVNGAGNRPVFIGGPGTQSPAGAGRAWRRSGAALRRSVGHPSGLNRPARCLTLAPDPHAP